MSNRERNIPVQFYMTREERQILDKKMEQSKIKNMGAYLRKMSIDGQIFNVDMSPLKSINSQMTRINTNINQITKRVNSTNTIYKEDIEEVQNGVEEIWQLLRSIQSDLQLN
ncbi:MAG: plasmid mobilization protein [Peptoniphilaceae bacterium]